MALEKLALVVLLRNLPQSVQTLDTVPREWILVSRRIVHEDEGEIRTKLGPQRFPLGSGLDRDRER